MKSIFKDFDTLTEKIKRAYSTEQYERLRSNFRLRANVIFSDFKKNNSLVLYLSKNAQKNYRGFSASSGLSFIGPSIAWKKIINGDKSLIECYTEGIIKVPNLRINWSKLWNFSNIITSLKKYQLD